MEKLIDVRGLSCPKPVIIALGKIKVCKTDRLKFIVDTNRCKENISKMVRTVGWDVDSIEPGENGYILTIVKKA